MNRLFSDTVLSILLNENFKKLIPYNINPEIVSFSNINAAFIVLLTKGKHPQYENSLKLYQKGKKNDLYKSIINFYESALSKIFNEVEQIYNNDKVFEETLLNVSKWLCENNFAKTDDLNEKLWQLFFPEGVGISGHENERIKSLREHRKIKITALNTNPIINPGRQILFTSNVLLSLPPASKPIEDLYIDDDLKKKLKNIEQEKQKYWFDHPVQIGVAPKNNEVLYGLKALDSAIEFEKNAGNFSKNEKAVCILSISVTHDGLHEIGGEYLYKELKKSGGLKNLEVYCFSETDTRKIIDDVLIPIAEKSDISNREYLYDVFGVDGKYGRHYSFLKAIAAFWNVFINPDIKATFKIDLDQVFPQKKLVEESGLSAFEHFKTPLWGAKGKDAYGNSIELGMIAGALVNHNDIEKSIFTPDVSFPKDKLVADEYIFFSRLPQALSTSAEMMTQYKVPGNDGENSCINRIHVTGGTNGILVDALKKHKPFTPSFIGRAEDQAYILSTFLETGPGLAYVHKPGLIMRHDKEGFAGEAIESAKIGKMIGDYIRILVFSSYAKNCFNAGTIKKYVDPFTGCFISKIPQTVVFLRFAFKAAGMFKNNKAAEADEFIQNGCLRITETLDYIEGESSELVKQYRRERKGWDIFYEILNFMENDKEKYNAFSEKANQITKLIKI